MLKGMQSSNQGISARTFLNRRCTKGLTKRGISGSGPQGRTSGYKNLSSTTRFSHEVFFFLFCSDDLISYLGVSDELPCHGEWS